MGDALKNSDEIKAMFARIARAYDVNNRLHTLLRDQAWRRRMVALAGISPGQSVLDAACGTGDVAVIVRRRGAGRVVGLDFCEQMLDVARWKHAGLNIEWRLADATALPFDAADFDVVTIAFGLRNIPQPQTALAEFHRVLRPGGRLMVLELGPTTNGIFRWCFERIMPRTAGLIARDRAAYQYLCDSMRAYKTPEELSAMIAQAGFTETRSWPLTFRVGAIYRGVKP